MSSLLTNSSAARVLSIWDGGWEDWGIWEMWGAGLGWEDGAEGLEEESWVRSSRAFRADISRAFTWLVAPDSERLRRRLMSSAVVMPSERPEDTRPVMPSAEPLEPRRLEERSILIIAAKPPPPAMPSVFSERFWARASRLPMARSTDSSRLREKPPMSTEERARRRGGGVLGSSSSSPSAMLPGRFVIMLGEGSPPLPTAARLMISVMPYWSSMLPSSS
mmetsp:Transcript_23099/g.43409  ORF Transcript_23099/g.43409 Transcript_23099/m.43409 type:complete len:220 (-) Transcript_23099:1022-1681(-)